MASSNNLVLQLLITAKDSASAVFGNLFSFLDRTTSATANLVREKFTDLFGGGMSGAIEFEAQLDRVAAKGGYTQQEVADLKTAAQQLGAQFGISGTEAAKGMESLAAAGLTAKEAIAALPQVLALAASEQISADAAATKLIDSLSIMGLGFEEAGRMADVLAKGANITTSSASQLAEALSEAGGVARAAGLDLEVTVAALDLLHKNGIKGSEAGTALKAILTALLDPASKASTELDALGITSRDLGTVMGELKGRGDSASNAILAFGTEAGPGLRALISEGQTGLNDYTAQLKDANGAAKQAADEMGGNLKSALATLSSAWESLKSALLDPLLEPITKQVKELAAAFQEGLSSDKFKAVQDTIKAFGEAAAQSIGDFIKAFDFQGALNAVAEFAADTKGHFEALSDAGSKAASVVSIAWNGVTATFKVIGAAMVEVVASIVATLANIEEAASKVGLGSVERANELRQTALNMQQTAVDLINGVRTNANQMGAAFDQLTTGATAAKGAVDALKEAASIPPDAVSLQPLVRTIEDYKAALDRAKVSQEQAAQAARNAEADYLLAGLAMDNGTGSAYRYEQASLANQGAQAALKITQEGLTQASSDYTLATQEAIRGIDAESQAATDSIKTKQQQIIETERARKAAKEYATAQEGLANAQLAGLRAEITLAEAKGDTAEAQRLTRDLAIKEAEVSVQVAKAKWAEQQAEAALALKKLEQLNAIKDKNEEQIKATELALLVAQRELAEAEAAGINAEAQQVLLEKLKLVNTEKEKSVDASEKNAEANREEAQATQEVAQETDRATESTNKLSIATARYGDATAVAFGTRGIQQYNDIIQQIQSSIDHANTRAQRLADEGMGAIAGSAADAALAIESIAKGLEDSESYLNNAARAAAGNLRNALASAREEAEGLAQSLKDMALDFEKEMLRIRGNEKELLKLEHEENLARLEEMAERAGSIASDEYALAKRRAEELHRLKMEQLDQEAKGDQATTRLNDLATAAERAGSALKDVSAIDLTRVTDQADRLHKSFSDLNGVL